MLDRVSPRLKCTSPGNGDLPPRARCSKIAIPRIATIWSGCSRNREQRTSTPHWRRHTARLLAGGGRRRSSARRSCSRPLKFWRPGRTTSAALSLAKKARPLGGFGETNRAVQILRYYAGEAQQPDGEHYPSRHNQTCSTPCGSRSASARSSPPGTSRSRFRPGRSPRRSPSATRSSSNRPATRRSGSALGRSAGRCRVAGRRARSRHRQRGKRRRSAVERSAVVAISFTGSTRSARNCVTSRPNAEPNSNSTRRQEPGHRAGRRRYRSRPAARDPGAMSHRSKMHRHQPRDHRPQPGR